MRSIQMRKDISNKPVAVDLDRLHLLIQATVQAETQRLFNKAVISKAPLEPFEITTLSKLTAILKDISSINNSEGPQQQPPSVVNNLNISSEELMKYLPNAKNK